MTYSAAIALLQGIRQSGQILGLETMQELVRRLGDPHRTLRFIHIAGTNGKGSVAAMLRAMLTTAGYRTGLYTSPHLVSVRERFQIDGQMIAKNDLARLVEQLKPVADAIARGGSTIGSMQSPSPVSSPPATGARSFSLSRRRERVRVRVADSNAVAAMPGLREPTYFEFLTALALQYFHEQKVDVVVWETGLGGRLDATNIVTPLVSVITNIAFDHMQYLGKIGRAHV